MNVTKQYFRYVSQNIFGLIGTSCYILADTYFIAQAAGTDGVAMLNLCLPIYNFIFAFGSMIGLGSATRYSILKAQNDERAHRYFSNGLMCASLIAVPFMLVGAFCPDAVLRLMGGDAAIVALGLQYTRIFLLFTPFFMCNYIVSAFTRNDGDPSLAMVATLSGSLFNVVFDYIFIFPMGWGLPGAALATAISPVISISICSLHFRKPTNGVQFVRQRPSAPELPAGHLRLCGGDVLCRDHDGLQPAAPAAGRQCGCGSLWRGGKLCTGGNGHLQRRLPGRAAAGEPVLRQARPGWCQEAAGPGQRHGAGAGSGAWSCSALRMRWWPSSTAKTPP